MTKKPVELRPGNKKLPMKLAFVVERLNTLQPLRDSTVALMRAASQRGHSLYAIDAPSLCWLRADPGQPSVFGEAVQVAIQPEDSESWYQEAGRGVMALCNFDAVLVRREPPLDQEYIATTWLLERAEAEGVRVFNRPALLRQYGDKLGIAEFPELTPPTLVSRQLAQLQGFIEEQRDVILKPLDGAGGRGVFRVHRHDSNRNVILETLTRQGSQTIMAQRYLSEIKQGDRRILVIAGKVVPYCLVRIAKAGEARASLETGAQVSAREITRHERGVAEELAGWLNQRGVFFAALDLIGDYLCEINLTCPAGLVELSQLSGLDVAAACITALEGRCL